MLSVYLSVWQVLWDNLPRDFKTHTGSVLFVCYMDASIEFLKGLVSRGDYGSERVNAQSTAKVISRNPIAPWSRRNLFTFVSRRCCADRLLHPRAYRIRSTTLKQASKSLGLAVNLDKSKVMVVRKGGHIASGGTWFYGGSVIEIVNSYKYLGYTLTTQLSMTSACE